MQSPKVSICIPAYKQVQYLKKTLDSIVAQNFQDFEVIITDDSPDDAVEKLISTYNFGEKLKYSRNATPLGTPENWNEGIRKAQGEYIKIMHHDDWFESTNSLGQFVDLLDKNRQADIAFCATKILNVKTNEYSYNSPTEEQVNEIIKNPETLFFGNYIGAPSATIYRRSLNILPDKRLKYVVDIDFYIRILKKNNNLAYSPTPLIVNVSNWEEQVTSKSLNKEVQLGEYSLLFNKLNGGSIPAKSYLNFFRNLFIKYNLTSLKQFGEFNAEPPRPEFIFNALIAYLKLRNRYSHE